MNIFTATFDHNASLLNKIVHAFENILKLWTPEIN